MQAIELPACRRSAPLPDTIPSDDDAVILVHGLWTGPWAMAWLGRQLAARGLRPYRFGYPSVRDGLGGNAAALRRFAAAVEAPRVHWLGHSLGGILILQALGEDAAAATGRVVMLGSPLAGSAAAARLSTHAVGRAMVGRSLRDWLARPQRRWPLAQDLGIIAGTGGVGMGRLVAPGLAQPHDGAVSVEETRLPGAREHLVLPVSHSGMLLSARVARHAAQFLLTGRFGEGDPPR